VGEQLRSSAGGHNIAEVVAKAGGDAFSPHAERITPPGRRWLASALRATGTTCQVSARASCCPPSALGATRLVVSARMISTPSRWPAAPCPTHSPCCVSVTMADGREVARSVKVIARAPARVACEDHVCAAALEYMDIMSDCSLCSEVNYRRPLLFSQQIAMLQHIAALAAATTTQRV
jgi:hypothetical protein